MSTNRALRPILLTGVVMSALLFMLLAVMTRRIVFVILGALFSIAGLGLLVYAGIVERDTTLSKWSPNLFVLSPTVAILLVIGLCIAFTVVCLIVF
jgi:hypothetical protein